MAFLDDITADLVHDEGLRLAVYDDRNALNIRPGSSVIGHPTIGYGRALDTQGVTQNEAAYLLRNDLDRIVTWVTDNVPYYIALNEFQQRVIVNMVYNLGMAGFMAFKIFGARAAQGDYVGAAEALLNSEAAKQDPERYCRLHDMMLANVGVA